MQTIVYKLGGSLLTLPDVGRRVSRLLAQPLPFTRKHGLTEAQRALLVVGGGETADIVRRWDQVHRLGDELAHDLALRSMSLNARMIAAILGNAQVVTSRNDADAAWSRGCLPVVAAAEFLEAEEKTHAPLPRSWDVTSDSVAAFVTHHWPADALVLIKSIPLPPGCDLANASRLEYVDAHFPRWANQIPQIGWANLRSEQPTIELWMRA